MVRNKESTLEETQLVNTRPHKNLGVLQLATSFMVLGLVAVTQSACEKHDIGEPCPQLLGDESAGTGTDNREETQEVVAQDLSFPCEELVCIATAGRPGYCSKKCLENAGCPDGFNCREVQPLGPFAGEKFCAWASCNKASDCGSTSEFCCIEGVNSDERVSGRYCAYKRGGSCP